MTIKLPVPAGRQDCRCGCGMCPADCPCPGNLAEGERCHCSAQQITQEKPSETSPALGWLISRICDPGQDSLEMADLEKWVQARLDDHAHWLAERIRAIGVDEFEGMNETARLIRWSRATTADYIDPRVEKPALPSDLIG